MANDPSQIKSMLGKEFGTGTLVECAITDFVDMYMINTIMPTKSNT
jgi:hypothetical protein